MIDVARRSLLKLAAIPMCSCCLGGAFPVQALAQERLRLNLSKSCSYDGRKRGPEDTYAFASSREASAFVETIAAKVGLPANFVTQAANVPNALATMGIDESKRPVRLILYSEVFMNEVTKATRTNWAGVSILAHEVGHHLSGHTLDDDGSRPPTELEADKFSGFVVRRMGGTLDDACAAMRALADERGSATHPPRSARLEAITVGWRNAAAEKETEPANPAGGSRGHDAGIGLFR